MVFNPVTFIKQSYSELGKVEWPTRAQTVRYTVVVAAVSIVVGVYIAGLDALFAMLADTFLYK